MVMQWDSADPGSIDRLRSMDPDSFDAWLEDVDDRLSFDVDKAWHAVHFALTGEAWDQVGPLGAVVLGGEPFGEDLGYGPARWLGPEAVAAAATALAALDPEELAGRLDFPRMAALGIYPSIWDRDPGGDQLSAFVVSAFGRIRDGFGDAADRGHGFVISLL
jgi:hypothetical protein